MPRVFSRELQVTLRSADRSEPGLLGLHCLLFGRTGKGPGKILTVSRPPLCGSYCGAVYHKLLGGCVIGGFSLQALKV